MILVSTLLSLASIASPLPLQDADERTMVLYDVSDLGSTKPWTIDEDTVIHAPGPAGERTIDDEKKRRRAEAFAALANVIQRHLQPPLDPKTHALQIMGEGIVAHVTPVQHDWIKAFLKRQRSDPGVFYTAEVRMVKLSAMTAVEIGMTELPLILDGEKASDLLKTCMELPNVDILTAPTVSVFGRQRAEISTIRQVAYVSRWERYEKVLPAGETILDPVVEVISEGITITCRVTPVDETLLDVDLQVKQSEITDLPTVQTELGEITVPVVTTRSMDTSLALQSGYTAVFPGLGAEGETTLLMVCVEILAPEKHEGPGVEKDQRRGR